MNDNKLHLDQVVLTKETDGSGNEVYKALAYSIVEHRAIDMTVEVLSDKTIVMSPYTHPTFPNSVVGTDVEFTTEELPAYMENLFEQEATPTTPPGSEVH